MYKDKENIVKVKVIKIDLERQKVGLSMKV